MIDDSINSNEHYVGIAEESLAPKGDPLMSKEGLKMQNTGLNVEMLEYIIRDEKLRV